MKLLIATAGLADVAWARGMGLLDGVYTTPTLLRAASANPRELVTELSVASHVPVHASVHAVTGSDIHREARDLARLGDQIVVHVPLVEDSFGAMHRLRADGVRVAAAFTFTPAQALLAARAGATSVVVPLAQAASAGLDAIQTLANIRAAFDSTHAECDLVAEGPASSTELAAAALAGADAVAASVAVVRASLLHPLTDRAVDAFLGDVAGYPRPWALE